MKTTKQQVMSSLIWRYAERFGAQGVTFIVSIILARVLEPEVYGTIALINVFIVILQVFIDSGLGNALIQKKDADSLDFSTVFYANIVFCAVLYLVLFFAAPFIAQYYENTQLTLLIRVLGIIVVISGIKNIQQAYVSRNLLFKKFFFSTLGGTISAAIIGIVMAYLGYGVWALVAQHLVNVAIDTIILWITVKWYPERKFSFQRLKTLYSYGWKVLCTSLIGTVYDNIRSLIIGKMYTSSSLAFYNKGQQFPGLIVTNINSSIDSVLFPTMSQQQDDVEKVKQILRRSISVATYLIVPLMVGLAMTAPNVVTLVLTEKWLPCVPFMQVFCLTFAFYPIHTGNLNAIKALGKSELVLKQEILKKIIGVLLLLVSMHFGVLAIAYSMLVASFVNQVINSWPNKKLLGYSYIEQLKDILPNLLLAGVMGLCVWGVGKLPALTIVVLILQILVGILVYLVGSILTKNSSFAYVWMTVKPILTRKKQKGKAS